MDPGTTPPSCNRFEPTTLSRCDRRDQAHRPRRHRVDQLRRAVQRGPHVRLARPPQRGPRRLERGHQLREAAALNFSPKTTRSTTCATRSPSEFVDVVRGPVGLLGRRRHRGRQGDRQPSSIQQGSAARPQGPVLSGEGADQHRALPAGTSGHHPGRRLEAGPELAARTADVVFSVVTATGVWPRRLRQLKGRMAKYGRDTNRSASSRRDADHRRDRRAGEEKLTGCRAGSRRPMR